MSPTGPDAEAIIETGEVTVFCSPFSSVHPVLMEQESLPTGIETPSFWQKSLVARTAS